MLRLDLLENAMDSFDESISYFIRAEDEEESRYYKFSILLLAHTTELMLKEILKEKGHHLLIYTEIDKIKPNRLSDAHTVNLEQSLNRLKLVGISIPDYIDRKIRGIYNERNKIQHFEIDLSKGEASKIVSEGIVAIQYLLEEIIGDNINDYLEEDLIEEIREIQSLYDSYVQLAKDKISNKNLSLLTYELFPDRMVKLPCPSCGEKYIVEEDGVIKCYFCSNEYENIKDCIENDEHCYISDVCERELNKRRNSGKYLIDYCKDCGTDNCYYNENKDSWFCVTCFNDYENTPCNNCGNPTLHKQVGFYYDSEQDLEPEYICSDCANNSTKYLEVRDWE
ncbi:hypothetical protein [Bacillus altitudinis]|uniref:hypothetical protein n=1 Tax=Bacillus altitudinis TaxID=293387 RepID=UPI00203AA8AC|nr:hypothetical protein [Bacillus altitudinis]MCM3044069.1 hypothetical protein [Bacillus altitudinis]MEC1804447.1 hypothetical protein [Bacillus altitudinis]